MNNLRLIEALLFAILLSAHTTALAQGGRVGEKVPEFQLQGTDGKFYGVVYSQKLISVLSFVGYD